MRGDAWKLAKNIFKLKETSKATFYSSSDKLFLPAASTMKPQKREFVVDSQARMPMVSKKDLDEAELETVRVSKNPTVVMTANCEVLAIEEATVFVGELDLFVTVMLLENTPSVLSLGKLEWPETTSHQERQENSLRHIKSCTIRRTWFVHEFLFFINSFIFIAGNCE